ncbi:flagellar basal-body rod protein FlgG [Rhodobacterales bacterium HKCCE4037]|nr:flagellar basal-body rod protein FlgG [Rhodobacterales bacterium HKCCE4037]
MRALDIAATGMSAQQLRVDVISNNIANMSTTGYSARRADFADLHYQQMTRAGAINAADGTIVPAGVQVGLGVRPTAVTVTWQQGTVAATGGDLDMAIEGRGYFEVTLPNGDSAYTRDGAFQRTGDGLIVTADGFEVNPGITIPADARAIEINASGEVYASFLGQIQPQLLGQINLVGFSNDSGLEAIGSNLFLETGASGAPFAAQPGEDGLGTLRQGYVEQSSVDAVREITDLIEAQRGYELNAKVLTAADQILGATTQVR